MNQNPKDPPRSVSGRLFIAIRYPFLLRGGTATARLPIRFFGRLHTENFTSQRGSHKSAFPSMQNRTPASPDEPLGS